MPKVLAPTFLQILDAGIGRRLLFGTSRKHSSYSVSRAFIYDQHELHSFLAMRMFPMPNVSTNSVELRRERFQRSLGSRGRLASFLAHWALELSSQFDNPGWRPSSLKCFDEVGDTAMTRGAMQ